jgi:hypothetical protein
MAKKWIPDRDQASAGEVGAATANLQPGTLLGFSGACGLSDIINVVTLGVPRWGLSHVGIMAEHRGELLLFESTTLDSRPCVIQQKLFNGTQAHRLDDVLTNYKGRVWAHPLSRPLYSFESQRLSDFLVGTIGVPYDQEGAMRSAGIGLSWVESLFRPEDLHTIFCSEWLAKAYCEIGLLLTDDASRWNPNRLARRLRRNHVVLKPRRLK